ncbi:MAG: hypothetical protein JXA66_02275 [Oligoflexia bacterium]|nr:hypothetical protein [Oligoflexia bacterium]
MKLVNVKQEQIDKGLFAHFDTLGLSNPLPYPPVAIEYNGNFVIVDGFKRLGNSASFLLVDENSVLRDYSDQITRWMEINSKHRSINELEKAVIVTKMSGFMDEKQLVLKLAPFFDISKKAIPDYRQYLSLPVNIQKYIAIHSPSRNTIRFILTAPAAIKSGVNNILTTAQPNSALLKQLVEFATDIFLSEGENYLDSNEFNNIVQNSGIKVAVERLRKKRLPKLSGLRTLIDREIKKVQTEILNISYDDNFEKPGFEIRANIKNPDDAEKIKSDLKIISGEENISNLFNIYKNEK